MEPKSFKLDAQDDLIILWLNASHFLIFMVLKKSCKYKHKQ